MAGIYEVCIKVKKIPSKTPLPQIWEGMDVHIQVNAKLNEINLRFVEHDEELDFLISLDYFIGEIKKMTKILAIDFEGFEALDVKKLFEVNEGLSKVNMQKCLKNLPISKNGELKPIVDAEDTKYIG